MLTAMMLLDVLDFLTSLPQTEKVMIVCIVLFLDHSYPYEGQPSCRTLSIFYMADSRKKTDLDPKAPQSTHLTSSTADDAGRQLH